MFSKVKRKFADCGDSALGDFTMTPRVASIACLAVGIGLVGALVALALLRLIGLFTNLFFYQRWNSSMVSPAANRLGLGRCWFPSRGH